MSSAPKHEEDLESGYASYGAGSDSLPLVSAPPFPAAEERPALAPAAWHDAAFAYAFLLHLALIVFLALDWGLKAVNLDAGSPANDGARAVFDFNAFTFTKLLAAAAIVSGVSAIAFVALLQRCAAALVRTALLASLAVHLVATCAMFAVSALFGFIMLIPLALSCWWVWFALKRVPFAAAHVELAVEATRSFPALNWFAIAMVGAQFTWLSLWQLAAFGVESMANNGGTAALATKSGSTTGGVLLFGMLVSLVWGAQLLSYATEFVVSSTVGSWWFLPTPGAPVAPSIKRAFTTSLGSLSLGALVVAVLEASRQAARAAQRAAERAEGRNRSALALLACVAACVIECVERLVETLNSWAVVFMALTGEDFRTSGGKAVELFRGRGLTLVVNEDLVAPALRIACLVPACVAAITGGALCYVGTSALPPADRGTLAGIAAFLSFLMGFAMASILSGVIHSAVRTIFVCFALYVPSLRRRCDL